MIKRTTQENITIDGNGDVVAGDKVENHYYSNKYTRLKRLFDALFEEVQQNEKLQIVCEELNRYLTDKDTIGLEQKLIDGGFNDSYITNATEQKEFFAKKLYRFQEYESAQFIYVDLLALIKTNFQDYVYPILKKEIDKSILNQTIREKIVDPILLILNTDGADDNILNLNAEEVKGMIYYLTGRCHIKWTNDSI